MRFPMVVRSFVAIGILMFGGVSVKAADAEYVLIIKDHKFTPTEIQVPVAVKFTLTVKNQDATPEEFESKDLRREKIVAGGKEIKLKIGPLKAGSYKFFGEYHEDSAKGVIIAK